MSDSNSNANVTPSMSVQWGGFSFSLSGPVDLVREGFDLLRSEVFPSLLAGGPPPSDTPAADTIGGVAANGTASTASEEISPAQFVEEKQPKTEMEKATVLAYFAKKHRGAAEFTLDDLEALYNEAHVPIRGVKNAIGNASKRANGGLLKSVAGKRGVYQVTAAGESYIKTKLPHGK
jgi:hypothetical protein